MASVIALVLLVIGLTSAKQQQYQLSSYMTLAWELLEDNTAISLTLTKNRTGWAAIGFGKDMSSAELFKIEKNPDTVGTCYLHGYSAPSCNMLQSWRLVQIKSNSTYFQATVYRKLARQDNAHGKDISTSVNDLIWACTDGDSLESHHDGKPGSGHGTLALDFSTGSTELSLKWGFMRHEYTQVIIWTLVADALITLAIHFKWIRHWQDIHFIVFTIVFALSYFARDTRQINWEAVDIPKFRESTGTLDNHRKFATALLYLSILQVIFGLGLRCLEFAPVFFRTQGKKQIFRMMHKISGGITWLTARITVYMGTILYSVKFNAAWLLVLVILETLLFVGGLIALQFYLKTRGVLQTECASDPAEYLEVRDEDIADVKPSRALIDTEKRMIVDLRNRLTQSELKEKYPKKIIVVHANKIYDMTGFNHPGGKELLEDACWTEVSRYLLGVTGIEKNPTDVWRHSKDAFSELHKRCIGHLYQEGQDLDDNWSLRSSNNYQVAFAIEDFTLESKTQLSKTTALFKWKNSKFSLNTGLPGISWLGRHYLVAAPKSTKKTRIYSQCQSMADEIMQYDKEVIRVFNETIDSVVEIAPPTTTWPDRIDYIPLVIKEYPSTDGISAHVHKMTPGDSVKFEGPYGTGFPISESMEGDVLMVAGGTGFVPFVDLINFLLKKAMVMALQKQGKKADFIMPKQDYLTPFKNTKFCLACSFRSSQDFVFNEMVEELVRINDTYDLNLFEFTLRIDDDTVEYKLPTVKTYFGESFLRDRLKSLTNLKMVLICGPEKMNTLVYEALTANLQVPSSNIAFI